MFTSRKSASINLITQTHSHLSKRCEDARDLSNFHQYQDTEDDFTKHENIILFDQDY